MGRTGWLQDRRMEKFRDVLRRWDGGDLSMEEAGELLGMSERQFRRYRDRYEDAGEDGLRDRRLGKLSTRRVPAEAIEEVLELYRHRYLGWNVKHFHEHLVRDHHFSWGYTFIKTQLHAAGLVDRAKRRGAHRRKRESSMTRSASRPKSASWRRPISGSTSALPELAFQFRDDDRYAMLRSLVRAVQKMRTRSISLSRMAIS